MFRFGQKIRSLHKWLGLLLFPWVMIYGFTGLYMNHGEKILSMFPADRIDAYLTEDARGLRADPESLNGWITKANLGSAVKDVREVLYHGKEAWLVLLQDDRELIVFKHSSQHVMKTNYQRTLYEQDGSISDRRIYWGRVLSEFHKRGMVSSPFGPYLADAFSVILILFGLTGLATWAVPKMVRAKARWFKPG